MNITRTAFVFTLSLWLPSANALTANPVSEPGMIGLLAVAGILGIVAWLRK